MRLFDYSHLAIKNLARQKVRTLLTIVAVIIGAVSVVVMLALVLGIDTVVRHQFESVGMLTRVQVKAAAHPGSLDKPAGQSTILDASIVARLGDIPHVLAVTPVQPIGNLRTIELEGGTTQLPLEGLTGYDPSPLLDRSLAAGRNLQAGDIGKLVIGAKLARDLGYEKEPHKLVGQKVLLTTQPGYTGWGMEMPPPPRDGDWDRYWRELENRTYRLEAEIIGVGAAGPEDYHNFITIGWAREIASWKQLKHDGQLERLGRNPWVVVKESEMDRRGYDSLILRVDSFDNVDKVAEAVEETGLGLAASTSKETLAALENAIRLLGIGLGSIGAISLGVASIGVINTMVMAIYERTREIGVMRACGATRVAIRRLFALEAALIGLMGGVIGLAISYLLAGFANYMFGIHSTTLGVSLTNVISFPIWLSAGVVAFTTVIGLLAGLYPAIRASRLNPVEALRYE